MLEAFTDRCEMNGFMLQMKATSYLQAMLDQAGDVYVPHVTITRKIPGKLCAGTKL
jgi:hypothetical protein